MMGLREKLNENPVYVAAAVVVVIGIAAWLLFSSGNEPAPSTDAYYSSDDGATWFAYKTEEMPPFDYKGKPAVRAYLYKCADGKPFVGFLERYTDTAKATLDSATELGKRGERPDIAKVQQAAMRGRMVKRPGDAQWTSGENMAALAKVATITCPDRSPAVAAD